MDPALLLPLHTERAMLENAGGKGANLAKLARAGFPVPDGFILTSEAYRRYLQANELAAGIHQALNAVSADGPAELERLSAGIRSSFAEGELPPELASAILEGYRRLGGGPVAVRSSATAEDLPEMSFAGQQDTFLNVIGEAPLLKAVVRCWSSLWTARAIAYRARNDLPQDELALAVIVQEMVPAEASGVLFTANPLTGLRTEAVIDAALGLGEALVSGQVEPDNYVVDTLKGCLVQKTLGGKAVAMRGQPEGGLAAEATRAAVRQAIPDETILALAELGRQAAALFDSPQDMEWAWANGKLHLLQSRPITSLFPVPEGLGPEPLEVLFSFASVQGIQEPLTPLGQDAIRLIFAGGASLFGRQATHQTQGFIHVAGERLWGGITPALRNTIGRKAVPRFLGAVEPSVVPALHELLEEPQIADRTGSPKPGTVLRLARFALPMLARVLRCWRDPVDRAEAIRRASELEIARLQAKYAQRQTGKNSLLQSIDLYKELYYAFIYAVPHIASGLVGGLIPLMALHRWSSHIGVEAGQVLEITRGLPNNVTTEMDLALWEVARSIQSNDAALGVLQGRSVEELAARYRLGRLPDTAQAAIASFLERYGMRGLGEIDLGRRRWREDPTPIMQVLKSYLQIQDESQAPDAVFRRAERRAEEAIAGLEATARSTRGGALKARLIRGAAQRVRALAGLRESPKFFIIQMMGIIRERLLESGQGLVEAGVLEGPEDLFFLYLDELEELAEGAAQDWRGRIADRRRNYERESRRAQIPRLLLSDGRAYYEGLIGLEDETGALRGSPVSPGVVEGTVRVVLDPHHADLAPGEILVCRSSDPAWTPLFLAAGGLVMEVGGMMTHGAIVAREYGIPAVVGVHQATTRLRTGQRIRVDGSAGQIVPLEPEQALQFSGSSGT